MEGLMNLPEMDFRLRSLFLPSAEVADRLERQEVPSSGESSGPLRCLNACRGEEGATASPPTKKGVSVG